jgi:hypothetical protein
MTKKEEERMTAQRQDLEVCEASKLRQDVYTAQT